MPQTEIIVGTGDPLESENLVEFRLLYSGRLLGASKSNTRAEVKHDLRREFHPQLRRLWAVNRNLDEFARHHCKPYFEKHPEVDPQTLTNEDFRKAGVEGISYNWERVGFNFVPLITEELCLRCKIEILFLRPDEPRYVMQGGDLDAKLKTVFDALRLPSCLKETGGMGPQEDETPFFCLLEDDKLISEVSVSTDQLLVLPRERDATPHDAFLVIRVQLNPVHLGKFSQLFG